MATLFTKIIDGEIPGRFVWRDEVCVAFLTIEPVAPGHVLVVPRAEVDEWVDLDDATRDHLFDVAARIGRSMRTVFDPVRIALMIQGFEVPHTHLHVWPATGIGDFDRAAIDRAPDPAALDAAAVALRGALRANGEPGVADEPA